MNKGFKKAAAGILGVVSAFLLVTVMSACAVRTTLEGDISEDGTYTITADRAKDDDMFIINYEIAEGTTSISIEANLTSGVLHVGLAAPIVIGESEEQSEDATVDEITDAATSFDFDEGDFVLTVDASGGGISTIDVEPGTYALVVAGDNASPATGTVTLTQN